MTDRDDPPTDRTLPDRIPSGASFEALADALDEHVDYRVLRRFVPRHAVHPERASGDDFVGLFVDVETTGLDASRDAIIEFAGVPFTYTREGWVAYVYEAYDALEDPGRPIPAAISKLTGITDEDVAGKRIDDERVAALVAAADLVIAHNASFDRPFLERRFPVLEQAAFACSRDDVAWREHGFGCRGLEHLARDFGVFYDAHRADVDCHVGIHVLAQPLPGSGGTVLGSLLASARAPIHYLEATDSPFDSKDKLKARGYRWNAAKKVWHTLVADDALADELAWLKAEVYGGRMPKLAPRPIGPTDRYSVRDPRTR